MKSGTCAIVTTLLVVPAIAGWGQAQPAPSPPKPKTRWTITGSLRVRGELWDWFGTGTGRGRYDFVGQQLRIAATGTAPGMDTVLELQQTGLFGLPGTATLAAPQGQLGHGAAYYDASGNQRVGIALKQAFWRFKDPKNPTSFLRLGRFEFIDGAEVAPTDPTLAALKRDRIAHRLIGPFGFTHVGRSFDGVHLSTGSKALNLTLFGGLPVAGVFDQKANDSLEGVTVAYGAVTIPLPSRTTPGEARLFAAYFDDHRVGIVKADNRPAAARAADTASVRLTTFGAHYLRTLPVGGGRMDALLWGAYQTGDWGALSHEAYAYAVEVGFQPEGIPGQPWIRFGYNEFSGDGSPGDTRHETFFPLLPTPRLYARFPFYTTANLKDAFVGVMLRPTPKWTARLDYHRLDLADRSDLWYIGGGAFQEKPSFGYAGRPSGGFGSLASVLDLSLDYALRPTTAITLYAAWAQGSNVIRSIYPGADAVYAYLEMTQKW